MQTLKITKISEGVFKHILVEESGLEHAFFNTKETKLSIDLGTFSISSAGQNRSFTVQNIQVYAIDAENPTATDTLDDLVSALADLKYPPLLDAQSSGEASISGFSTEAKQDVANTSLAKISKNTSSLYTANVEEDTASSTTYIGKQSNDGVWILQKVVDSTSGSTTSTSILYASAVNNTSVTSYDDAWDNRTTLNYSLINNLL